MKQDVIKKNGKTTYLNEFSSISEFNDYICNTPINEAFRWSTLSSVSGEEKFCKTNSFEEASWLMKNGCEDIAKKLTNKIDAKNITMDVSRIVKNIYDVQGFQCCVPLYLQGVPTNMISRKTMTIKQKVITITKAITYSGGATTDEIIEESVKALQVVKKIESQGVRCNLNILFASHKKNVEIFCKIRIKNSNEKLNVSKLAFCMVHPSMLRRMLFRFMEVFPNTTDSFVDGYGQVVPEFVQKNYLEKNEYYIPAFLNKEIESLKDLQAIC